MAGLLEREQFLASLEEYAVDAQAGDSRLVLIGGEAGVGKTALVEALRGRLGPARWLWGACEGSFTPRALGPLYDVGAQAGGALDAACRADAPRERLFRALLDDVTEHDGLTVLVIEDVHWADEATLDLLQFLARRLRGARALVLVTYRDDGLAASDPLRVTIGEIGPQRGARRMALPPLSIDAVERLAAGRDLRAADLFTLTGGNPFLVTEILEAPTEAVPESARDAVLARVGRLSDHARRVLDTAALIGLRVDVPVLKDAAQASDGAIDECLTAGALVSDASVFRFRHELARLAVTEAVPAHRRAELHGRILEVLLQRGETDEARLAYHAEGAGDGPAVLRFAPDAARRASALAAHREAAAQYQRALRFAPSASPRQQAELWSRLAEETSLVDAWEDSAAALERARDLWAALDEPLQVGDCLRLMATALWRLCRLDEGLAVGRQAVELLEPLGPSVQLGWAYANAAMFGEASAAPELCHKARELGERFGDRSLVANVLNTLGVAKQNLGDDGVPDLRAALDLALEVGDDQQVGRSYANLQVLHFCRLELAEAEQVYKEGVVYSEDHDLATYANCLRGGQSDVAQLLGRWDEAVQLVEFDLHERNLSPINKIQKLICLGLIEARRGRPSTALEAVAPLVETGGGNFYGVSLALAQTEAAWLAGDGAAMQRAVETATELLDIEADPYMYGATPLWRRRAGLGAEPNDRMPDPHRMLFEGDWRASAEAWAALDCPYERGLALLDSGDHEAMLEAVRVFDALGAKATVARAQAILRQHGVRAIPRGRRADTRENRFGLTAREREVLGLVAEGLTNSDIAKRLVIAEKTVDNHVSSVLAKMGVESRRDAARLAVGEDLAAAHP